MVDLTGFDASQFEPLPPSGPVPPGKYVAVITASDLKSNRAGNGRYLELVFTITEGEYAGRQLRQRLNLSHPNPVAVKLAHAELAAICRAVGILTPRDSVELHNHPLVIRVGHRQRPDTGETTNTIIGYEKKDSLSGQSQQRQTNTPPWRR